MCRKLRKKCLIINNRIIIMMIILINSKDLFKGFLFKAFKS